MIQNSFRGVGLMAAILALSACQTPPPTPSAPVPEPAAPRGETSNLDLPGEIHSPPRPFPGAGWKSLWDGKTLEGWAEARFSGRGEVECADGVVLLHMGEPFTGITRTEDFPRNNYEIAFDAMRVMGSDFFCGLTVPVGESFCSLIVGGWGGSLLGISSLDGLDASENETAKFLRFDNGRWYRLRMRVCPARIQVWLDEEKLVDVNTEGRRVSLRLGEIELLKPLGIASWQTTAAIRELKMRRVEGPAQD